LTLNGRLEKPTLLGAVGTAEKCQEETFDRLVGAAEQRKREGCQVESPYAGSGNEGVIAALRL
jgi:hypothetical protein